MCPTEGTWFFSPGDNTFTGYVDPNGGQNPDVDTAQEALYRKVVDDE